MITQAEYFEKSKVISFRKDGYVDNWFSNMLPLDVPLEHEGIKYSTSENFYQAMKIPAHRRELRVEIAAMNPYAAKHCFRKQADKFIVRDDWTAGMKLRMMQYVLNYKFHGDDVLPATSWHMLLMSTKDEPIIEFNNWGDTFWGWDIRKKRGSNHLGKILMTIRAKYNTQTINKFLS